MALTSRGAKAHPWDDFEAFRFDRVYAKLQGRGHRVINFSELRQGRVINTHKLCQPRVLAKL